MLIFPHSGTSAQQPNYTNNIFDQTDAAVSKTGTHWSTATHTNLDYGNTELDNSGTTPAKR